MDRLYTVFHSYGNILMNHKPRQVSNWEIIRGFVFALFIIPVIIFLLALAAHYSDVIDNILK